MVGQIADRVERLAGRTRCNQYLFARHRLGTKDVLENMGNQQLFIRQLACAHILAGEHSNCRLDDLKAVALQGGKVVLGDRIVEHIGVHCRRHQFRTVAGKHGGREHIVRKPVRHLCNDVGSGRRYQHKVSPLCQRHMLDTVLKVAVKGVDHAAAVAQCLKGERGDELSGIFCHNDLHVTVHLCQTAGDICHFIGSDGAGDPQHHGLSL